MHHGRRFVGSVATLITLLCCSLAVAAEGPLKVKVTLYPAGSFEITTDHIDGAGKKTGDKYAAKTVKVAVNSLKTGMSLRDRHLHEKLEAEKYAFITITDINATGGKGTAKITIRAVTKDVAFTYKESGSGKATATFKLKLTDFNLTGINYKGVGVEDEVEVTATIPYS